MNLLRAEEMPPGQTDHGTLLKKVSCRADPSQSYALYLPPGYSPNQVWPVLYCFDPGARGLLPVERFLSVAERLGYIVVGSYNSRNGDMDVSVRAAQALLRDTEQRLKIDPQRRYAVGFSGGARVACFVAGEYHLAGVVASGAGFPEGETPREVSFAFFGAVGREDMNYLEMRRTQTELSQRIGAQRLAVFEGSHEWLPVATATEAVEWLELQAMRTGSLPQNDAWIAEIFMRWKNRAQSRPKDGQAYDECRELATDFKGLVDLRELEDWLAARRDAKSVRRYRAAETKLTKEEERWDERLVKAISHAVQGGSEESEMAETPFPSSQGMAFSRSPWDCAPGETGAFAPPAVALLKPRSGDRFALLREEAEDARREWNRSIAVRRAVRAANGRLREHAAGKMFLKEYDLAGEMLEMAVILQPEDSATYFNLAWVRALQGRREEALQQMTKATQRGFSDQSKLSELGRALTQGTKDKTVLEPMFITSKRELFSSYGLGLTFYADPATRELVRIAIIDVVPNSEAEALGLGQSEEIIRVDGRDIRSFFADFSPDSELARLFSGRRKGETIDLEIKEGSNEKPRSVRLTQGRTAEMVMRPWLRDK